MYRCAACGKPLVIVDRVRVRTCKHTDAAIVAEMTAKAQGHGGLR